MWRYPTWRPGCSHQVFVCPLLIPIFFLALTSWLVCPLSCPVCFLRFLLLYMCLMDSYGRTCPVSACYSDSLSLPDCLHACLADWLAAVAVARWVSQDVSVFCVHLALFCHGWSCLPVSNAHAVLTPSTKRTSAPKQVEEHACQTRWRPNPLHRIGGFSRFGTRIATTPRRARNVHRALPPFIAHP